MLRLRDPTAAHDRTISNPLEMAAAFRCQLNQLRNSQPVSAICLRRSNDVFWSRVLASGQGRQWRLSGFPIHPTLRRSGALEQGSLLPISVVMKRDEIDFQ